MSKQGLSAATQDRITQVVRRYAAQGARCSVAEVFASLYPGRVYNPRHSSLRVTLAWMVRQGLLRRHHLGRHSAFYPVGDEGGAS